jgi:D-aminopeptidase
MQDTLPTIFGFTRLGREFDFIVAVCFLLGWLCRPGWKATGDTGRLVYTIGVHRDRKMTSEYLKFRCGMRVRMRFEVVTITLLLCAPFVGQSSAKPPRPRVRDIGLKIGVLPTGPLNAITDVAGVEVGHTTLVVGDNIRTGVTAILPHPGNLFQEKVPAAVFVGNAFGKLAGSTQVNELGEIETPIVLTTTLSVSDVAGAVIDYMLALPGNNEVESINPIVGETNDGYLNDIRGRHISGEDVIAAIKTAHGGPVEEGAVGAGTGTVAFGFKGGIGTSSRRLPPALSGYTVGVLVQSNFGGVLTIGGAPVGQELGQYYLKDDLEQTTVGKVKGNTQERMAHLHGPTETMIDLANGSIMMVVATDAPVDSRNLRRMAARAMMGLARTGASGSNGSGDYVIAFSSALDLRIQSEGGLHPERSSSYQYSPRPTKVLPNDAMSPLFLAVIEATQEAVYNSLFQATTTTGKGRTVQALPLKETVEILRRHRVLDETKPSGSEK